MNIDITFSKIIIIWAMIDYIARLSTDWITTKFQMIAIILIIITAILSDMISKKN